MGAYENPEIQSLDYSFITKGVAGIGATLALQKQQRADVREKVKLRKMKIIEQETGLTSKINELPEAQATTFDENVKVALQEQLDNVHTLGQDYARTGSVEDYEAYTKAKTNLQSSLPKMKMAIDNMNRDLTQGAKAVDAGGLEGQNGVWSYNTPMYAINMANDWKNGGGGITMDYDASRGEWNFKYDNKGEEIDLNSKAWLNKVSEKGEGLFTYVENNYLVDDKKTFEAIAGDNYKGFVSSYQGDPKKDGVYNRQTTTAAEKWGKANENLNERYNNKEEILMQHLDNTLTPNRWEAQQNYSKFGPYKPNDNIRVKKDENGKIVAYIDTFDESTGEKIDGKWVFLGGKKEEDFKNVKSSVVTQLDYLRDQTWNNWQDQYAMEDRVKSVTTTKTSTSEDLSNIIQPPSDNNKDYDGVTKVQEYTKPGFKLWEWGSTEE